METTHMQPDQWGTERADRWARIRTIDLTTTGRRSGALRRIEIWWFHFEGRFVITGTPGARDWLANVLAEPKVQIHVDGDGVHAIATPVDDPEFRRRFFEHRAASWYSSMAELEALVEDAPMVVLTPAG
jgi:deazaflavin-dependent oxidoreductase (nitroreductase family)